MACEDYPIYVHWYQTLDTILDRAESFPRNARFTLASRIADAGLDVMEGIVRAIYTRDRAPLLAEVNMKLEWLRVLFRIAHRRRYLSTAQYEAMARDLNLTGRMAGSWSKGFLGRRVFPRYLRLSNEGWRRSRRRIGQCIDAWRAGRIDDPALACRLASLIGHRDALRDTAAGAASGHHRRARAVFGARRETVGDTNPGIDTRQ